MAIIHIKLLAVSEVQANTGDTWQG